MGNRTAYHSKPNATCPWCGVIVLAENLEAHKKTERCRRLTFRKHQEENEWKTELDIKDDLTLDILGLQEDSALDEKLDIGFRMIEGD